MPCVSIHGVGSGALVQLPQVFSSSIFFQSVSLLLFITLHIHAENLQLHKDVKLFKFYSGFFKRESSSRDYSLGYVTFPCDGEPSCDTIIALLGSALKEL